MSQLSLETDGQPPIPDKLTLDALREAVQGCRACPLWEGTTQAVFGEGLKKSELMLVGEQPGDQEDRQGRPFVGPAGRVLDKGLEDAGIDRSDVYITNVVKHFKYRQRGKRRIHQKPDAAEQAACRPWLEAELDVVRPTALVCLGATAAQSLLGRQFRVTRQHGELVESDWAPIVSATAHPSSILRAEDEESREAAYRQFVADLSNVAGAMAERARGTPGAAGG